MPCIVLLAGLYASFHIKRNYLFYNGNFNVCLRRYIYLNIILLTSSPAGFLAAAFESSSVTRGGKDRFLVSRDACHWAAYALVWWYATQNLIKLRIHQPAKGAEAAQIKAGAEAQYSPASKTMRFPDYKYGYAPNERKSILHEATHALRHIMAQAKEGEGMYGSSNLGGQDIHDNEVAAYIAASLFYIYDNGKMLPAGYGETSGIYWAANSIANKIKNNRGAHVSESDQRDLKMKIALTPLYMVEPGADRSDPTKYW